MYTALTNVVSLFGLQFDSPDMKRCVRYTFESPCRREASMGDSKPEEAIKVAAYTEPATPSRRLHSRGWNRPSYDARWRPLHGYLIGVNSPPHHAAAVPEITAARIMYRDHSFMDSNPHQFEDPMTSGGSANCWWEASIPYHPFPPISSLSFSPLPLSHLLLPLSLLP